MLFKILEKELLKLENFIRWLMFRKEIKLPYIVNWFKATLSCHSTNNSNKRAVQHFIFPQHAIVNTWQV